MGFLRFKGRCPTRGPASGAGPQYSDAAGNMEVVDCNNRVTTSGRLFMNDNDRVSDHIGIVA